MKVDIREAELIILDKFCWSCGGTSEMTIHHSIPSYLKPKKNVLVPVCKKCHDEMNNLDAGALKAFSYKIMKQGQKMLARLKGWT